MQQQVGELNAEIKQRDARITRLKTELEGETARYADIADVSVIAPSTGSVWEVLTAPGEQVKRGQELARMLDCNSAVVTAAVSESVYNRLRAGQAAKFRLRDGSKDLDGRIVHLTGVAAAPANFAIAPSALTRESYRVTVKVPDLAKSATCDLGRTGRVLFSSSGGAAAAPALLKMSPIATTIMNGAWPGIVAAGLVVALLPWLRRESSMARTIVIAVSITLGWQYMFWRVTQTLPDAGFTADYVVGVLFVTVEALALLSTSLSFFFLTRIRNRTKDVEDNMSWLMSQPVLPRVDVLVCTYNEDDNILEQTIVGAMAMEYANFRVWVCDDGRRPWLGELCRKLGCGYITRNDNAHAKAGNINNALKHLSTLPDPPQFISILDADFVPTPQFLTRTMTLFRDETVGIVQTPQHFINPDPIGGNLSTGRVWPDEQRYFFDVLMASKDAWGAAFCCGTSSVLRYAALMKIGGFPTDSVTEDYLVTLRLRAIGYQTVYLNERLSLGLAPEGLKEYITQRSRWCLGFVQICAARADHGGSTAISRLSIASSCPGHSSTGALRTLFAWPGSSSRSSICWAAWRRCTRTSRIRWPISFRTSWRRWPS
ncbi:MAG: glycosyltransferase [Rhodospirillales bacterium]|nr:glycosyltransferase [Rhodospirillales bacterium]